MKVSSEQQTAVAEGIGTVTREGFEAIVQKYMKDAYFIALGFVGNREDAMDLSQEAFAKVGSQYLHILSQLKFEPVRRKNGSTVILVTTNYAVREPFLDFLVEVNWPNGRLVREYTVLLEIRLRLSMQSTDKRTARVPG